MAQQEKVLPVRGEPEASTGQSAAVRTWIKTGDASQVGQDIGLRVGSIVTLEFIWWVLTLFFPPTLIPNPWDTFAEVAAIITTGNFFVEMGNTLRRVLAVSSWSPGSDTTI